MLDWLRSKLRRSKPESDSTEDDSERIWDERLNALSERLGPPEDTLFHAVIPLYLGGDADVVEFRQHVDGHCYVTSDLTGDRSQLKSALGNYELMICTRGRGDWAANLISRLAKYTFEAVLQPGQTMDIGPALPEGSRATALLFAEPEVPSNRFEVDGLKSGILLCITLMQDELDLCLHGRSKQVLHALKAKGVFPFSDLNRESVL